MGIFSDAFDVLFPPPPERADVAENRRLRARRDELALAEENVALRDEVAELERRALQRERRGS